MSKKSVWNRGKHNGGGISKNKVPVKPIETISDSQPATTGSTESSDVMKDNRIDVVKRMNRENWVVRPTRVNQDSSKKDGSNKNPKI